MKRHLRAVRMAVLVVIVAFALVALWRSWDDVRPQIERLTTPAIVAAGVAFLVGTALQFLAWRSMLGAVGAPELPVHDSLTTFATGQLGKYVPGSVMPALIQADLGRRNGVPWRVMVSSYGLLLMLGASTGGIVGLLTLTGPSASWVPAAVVAVGVGGVVLTWLVLHPAAAHRVLDKLLARVTGGGLPSRLNVPSALVAATLTLGAWVPFGLHAWLICRPLGAGTGDVVFIVGAFAFAWVCGIVAVPFPAGLGIREAVLIVTVGELLGRPEATTLALVSRLVQVVVDLLLAAATGVPHALRRVKRAEVEAAKS